MAAKDYVFVTGWRDAYLAKKKKSNSPMMSTDRRVIEDNEIIGLFEFYLRKQCSKSGKSTENRDHATIFKGKKYAEREADKMLLEDNYLVCYSIQEV